MASRQGILFPKAIQIHPYVGNATVCSALRHIWTLFPLPHLHLVAPALDLSLTADTTFCDQRSVGSKSRQTVRAVGHTLLIRASCCQERSKFQIWSAQILCFSPDQVALHDAKRAHVASRQKYYLNVFLGTAQSYSEQQGKEGNSSVGIVFYSIQYCGTQLPTCSCCRLTYWRIYLY